METLLLIDISVFSPTGGIGRMTKLLLVENSCGETPTISLAPRRVPTVVQRGVSELQLDGALTERSKEEYSASRDDNPS